MWYAGAASGELQTRSQRAAGSAIAATRSLQRSRSQPFRHPVNVCSGEAGGAQATNQAASVPARRQHNVAADLASGTVAFHSGSGLRGGRQGRQVLGKNQPATAAALLSLAASTDTRSAETMEASQANELLRIGPWSIRRAPGGPDAGLLYVNVETGSAQKNPPAEVLEDLDMVHGASTENNEDLGTDHHTAASSTSSSGIQGSERRSRFRRILLGNGHDVPLAMARDIHVALLEDSTIFEEVRRRFSDACDENGPVELEGLPGELQGVAEALDTGEISDVIGTEDGMQILLRVS